MVKKGLFSGNDFGIELNLGFESHYDFASSVKNFSNENAIHVFLFFSDDIDLCYKRAELRHRFGLHYVNPETIKEMYENTFTLLRANFDIITEITAIDVSRNKHPKVCLTFNKLQKAIAVTDDLPLWVITELKPLLELQTGLSQLVKIQQQQTRRRPTKGRKFRL